MTRSDIYHQLPLLHHSYRGLTEGEAEKNFLKEVQRLKEYGTLFYHVSRVCLRTFSVIFEHADICEILAARIWKALEVRIIGIRMYRLSVITKARQESYIANMQSKERERTRKLKTSFVKFVTVIIEFDLESRFILQIYFKFDLWTILLRFSSLTVNSFSSVVQEKSSRCNITWYMRQGHRSL